MKRVVGLKRVAAVGLGQRRERRRLRSRFRRAVTKAVREMHREEAVRFAVRNATGPIRTTDRRQIMLPAVFSLRTNRDATLAVIDALRRSVLLGRRPVLLHFRDVEELEPAATLMLTAEIFRCQHLRAGRGSRMVNGTYPAKAEILHQLREMGFYRLLDVNDRRDVPESVDRAGRPFFVPFRSYMKVEPEFAAMFCDLVTVGAFEMTALVKGRMVAALKEAMGNTVEHAYKGSGPFPVMRGRWWVGGYVDPENGEMMISIYDQGVGIPGTVDPRLVERLLSLGIGFAWQPTDGHMIAAATQMYRTSTDQPGRGRGLQDMKKFVDTCDDGELRILSNRGSYHYINGEQKIDDENGSIGGTLVEWRVRHGKQLEIHDV